MSPYDAKIQAAFLQLINARGNYERRIAGKTFTDLIRLRNAERKPNEIARLERSKRLR